MFSGWFASTTTYEIGAYQIEEEEKISEGGYAYVYRVHDIKTGQKYGLKKILLHVLYRFVSMMELRNQL